MIVDTSAMVAVVRGEAERSQFLSALDRDAINRISAATYLETSIVVDGSRDPVLSRDLDAFLDAAKIILEPVTEEQAKVARAAYRDFGKGSGHPAQLNFGDCFAYALAKHRGEALLFKGNDFSHTDIKSALG